MVWGTVQAPPQSILQYFHYSPKEPCAQVCGRHIFSFLWNILPGVKLLDHIINVFNILRHFQTILSSAAPFCTLVLRSSPASPQ